MAHWLLLAIQASIFLSMVSLGLVSTWADATWLFRHPALLLRAFLAMSVIVPLVAIAISVISGMPREIAVGLVALSLSPVPPILYKKQLRTGGRREYVVGLLVAMSVLSVVTIPVSVALVTRAFDGSAVTAPTTIAKIVLETVLIPLGLGIVLRRCAPGLERAARPVSAAAGLLLIVGVLGLLLGMAGEMSSLFGGGVVLMLVILAVVALAVGHLLGGPSPDDRTVLATATTSRHPGVALAIAVSGTLAEKSELAVVLLYLLVSMAVSWPYLRLRARARSADSNATDRSQGAT